MEKEYGMKKVLHGEDIVDIAMVLKAGNTRKLACKYAKIPMLGSVE